MGLKTFLNARLVPNWHQAWRWASMQGMALAIVIISAWSIMPASLLAYLPSWMGKALAILALLFAIVGRMTRQPQPAPVAVRKFAIPDLTGIGTWLKLASYLATAGIAAFVAVYITNAVDQRTIADMKAAQAVADLNAQLASDKASGDLAAMAQKIDAQFAADFSAITVLTQTQIKEVTRYVTPDIDRRYPLACGFVRVRDAAIIGTDPANIAAAGCSDDAAAAPVAASVVSAGDVSNYGICHEDELKAHALQVYVAQLLSTYEAYRLSVTKVRK